MTLIRSHDNVSFVNSHICDCIFLDTVGCTMTALALLSILIHDIREYLNVK